MTIINNFITEYGTLLLYTAITAIVGMVAGFIKKKYTEKVNTETKKQVVKTVVNAIQQLYTDLDGEAKKEKAIESISAMLAEKGITITPLEIDMLIEAAIAEAKKVWEKTEPYGVEDVADDESEYTVTITEYDEPEGNYIRG